jgi:putative heme iron utilization protein
MNATPKPLAPPFDARAQAKGLLRVARTAALATLDRNSAAPLTTLVSVATDYDGAPLLLLSELAQHTKNLAADRRGSLLLTTSAGRGDPLNRPRLTVGGPIAAYRAPTARVRFVAHNPKSKLYASFGDFSMFRMEISAVHFNGGFARAAPLTATEILTDINGADALIEAEQALLAEINGGAAGLAAKLAGFGESGTKSAWRAIGLDPEGLDLAAGSRAARLSFEAPAITPQAWRAALDAYSRPRAD